MVQILQLKDQSYQTRFKKIQPYATNKNHTNIKTQGVKIKRIKN